jgi:origin recognition complex subunit 5
MKNDRPIGFEALHEELEGIIEAYPPPFIYMNDTTSSRLTSSIVQELLRKRMEVTRDPGPSKPFAWAYLNAAATFTPRILYDTIINGLTQWTPDWETGCANWSPNNSQQRWNDSFDSFATGLRAVNTHLRNSNLLNGEVNSQPPTSPRKKKGPAKGSRKGKEKALEDVAALSLKDVEDITFAIFIDQADRLKDNLPELLVPLTRLGEIVRLLTRNYPIPT